MTEFVSSPAGVWDSAGAPCSWEVVYPSGMCDALESLDAAMRSQMEAVAVQYLWLWSERQFGLCDTVVRPCRERYERPSTFEGRGPYTGLDSGWNGTIINGAWYAIRCSACGDSCGCQSPRSLILPGPLVEVSEVLIDGDALDPAAYRIDNRRALMRIDGQGWPTSQNMYLEPSEVGTFQVSYTRGTPVPQGGQMAAGALACELAKAYANDPTCALPKRVQSITRQGVTIAMLDSFDDVERGHTGIWVIDSWLASVTRTARPSTVHSVDRPRMPNRRSTWP